MAGNHELRATIIVSGKEDGSLTQIGNKLQSMAREVQQISEAALEFEKQSVEVYKNYEDGILETRSVLQSTYASTARLNADMDKLEEHAQRWAETTIFGTADVANAMANAAHAGWDYTKIVQGIPAAMLIAQAGNLELADGVDYLTKMMAATGTEFEGSIGFVNEWAKAADLAATDIKEIGDAFTKMGTASRLADNNEELFTMLAILANSGTVGTAAGTALRNVMARLAAPTGKAQEAMDALGISEEEAQEAMEGLDEASAEAYQMLIDMGFSAYDAQGNLKPYVQIITELNEMLQGMDEKSRNDFLKTLFGTRSFQYAMTLLDAANNGEITSIYEAILGVKDTDYAEQKASTLMSGLTGSLAIMESKIEEFKRKVGSVLAPHLENAFSFFDGIIDGLNSLDPAVLDGLVAGLTVIAGTAPALLTIGAAMKIIGALGLGSGFAWMAAAAGVAALAVAFAELRQEAFESNWGDMDLDTDPLNSYLGGLDETFKSLNADISGYAAAAQEAIDNYTQISQDLSSDLLTKTILGTQLTDEDITNITQLGYQMHTLLTDAIVNGQADEMNWLEKFFSLGGKDPTDNDAYNSLILANYINYGDLLAEADRLGAELGSTIASAMADGIINGEEYQAILQVMDQMNELMAIGTRADREGKMAQDLRDAQRVSWDSFEEWYTGKMSEYNANVESENSEFEYEYARQRSLFESYIEKGYINPMTGKKYTNADWWQVSAGMKRQHAENLEWYRSGYEDVMTRGIETLLNSGDTPMFDAWNYLLGSDGVYHPEDFENNPELAAGIQAFAKYASQMMPVLGSYAELNGYDIQAMRDNAVLFTEAMQANADSVSASTDVWEQYNAEAAQTDHDSTALVDSLKYIGENFGSFMNDPFGNGETEVGTGFTIDESDGVTVAPITEYMKYLGEAATELSQGMNDPFGNGTTDRGTGFSFDDDNGVYVPEFARDMVDAVSSASTVGGEETKSLFSRLIDLFVPSANEGEEPMQLYPIEGGSYDTHGDAISAYDQTIDQNVSVTDNGSGSSLKSSLESMFSSSITQNVSVVKTGGGGGMTGFANGGRATEASVFGEAGAEWAIPEQHSDRTAELLTSAAEASGFTWGELLTRNGGLNSGSGSGSTLVYSPTINAGGDAESIAQILKDDKARMEKWWRERMMRESVAGYA